MLGCTKSPMAMWWRLGYAILPQEALTGKNGTPSYLRFFMRPPNPNRKEVIRPSPFLGFQGVTAGMAVGGSPNLTKMGLTGTIATVCMSYWWSATYPLAR